MPAGTGTVWSFLMNFERGPARGLAHVACLTVLLGLILPMSYGQTPAPGFEDTEVFRLLGAVSMSFAPDGTLFVAQSGPSEGMHVWVWRGGDPVLFHSFPGTVMGEWGIQTLTVDPNYEDNGYIWILRSVIDDASTSNPTARLSRFTNPNHGHGIGGGAQQRHDEPDALEDEFIVFETGPAQGLLHQGGCFAFGTDGSIYVGLGDDTLGSVTSQDPFSLQGSIMHFNADGTPAADNPYLDGVDGDPRVWATGVRNPFRCVMQPGLDNLFVADVGGAGFEELSIAFSGANLGWATIEGPEPPGMPGFLYPIYSYPHGDQPGAIVAGAFAEAGDFDPLYEGDLFFGDWSRSEIYRMVLDVTNQPVRVETFVSNAANPVDFEFGPDGALYYIARGLNRVRRIAFVGGTNRQPVAVASATPMSGPAPLAVTLDGSGSYDADEDPLTYAWDRGDGTNGSGVVDNHTYTAGAYDITLTVDDGQGLTGVAPTLRVVSGNEAPTASIAAPVNGLMYNAGDEIVYSGSGSDPEEGAIPCSQLSWQVLLHHDEHTHPFIGPTQGDCSSSFIAEKRGETSPNVWYSVRVFASDTGSPIGEGAELTGEQVVEIFPNKTMLTFETLPRPDLTVELDTVPLTAPATIEGVVGMYRRLGAPQQTLDGHTYSWLSWSNGGAADHEIEAPPLDTTYTATFGCDVIVEVERLSVEKTAQPGEVTLRWLGVDDDCLAATDQRYRVYGAPSPLPGAGAGPFPGNTDFELVGSTMAEELTFAPGAQVQYFLVVATGTDLDDGPVGHYFP